MRIQKLKRDKFKKALYFLVVSTFKVISYDPIDMFFESVCELCLSIPFRLLRNFAYVK